jgi:hypothetical protein
MQDRILSGPVPALALALVLGAGVTACDADEPSFPTGDGKTSLSVLLTDAPGAVEAVWVDIAEIYLQGIDGPVVLLDEPTGLIEVTELVGTSRTLVADAEVDATSYGQLRLVVAGAVLETKSGGVYTLGGAEHPDGLEATGDLMCPSCAQSGLKVVIPHDDIEMEEGVAALLLDFDVAQSFGHQAGASGKWVMRPVIHATLVLDENGDGIPDFEQAGSIVGTVGLAEGLTIPECPAGTPRSLSDFVPTATAQTLTDDEGMPILRTGTMLEGGGFVMSFLTPDTYTMGYQGQLEFEGASLVFTAGVVPAAAEVVDGEFDGVAYTVTGATCEVG